VFKVAGQFGRNLQTAAVAEVFPFSYLFINCFSCDKIFRFKNGVSSHVTWGTGIAWVKNLQVFVEWAWK